MPSIINALTAAGGGVAISGDATGNLALQSAGTTAMTIDTSQNVGIGTSSPSYKFQVQSAGQTNGYIYNSTNAVGLRLIADSSAAYVQTQTNHPLYFTTNNGANALTVETNGDIKMNSGYGSAAVAYGCRAWVNYNAVSASIRGSGNVSSVTNNGAGDNTVNFTTAMPDVNYSWSIMQQLNGTGNNDVGASSTARNQGTNAWGTGFLRILTMSHSNTTQENPLVLTVAVFR